MNLVLLKYYLTIVLKKRERKRDEKMACQRIMTQKKRERKDGMPKKHDPANKIKYEKKHVFICTIT